MRAKPDTWGWIGILAVALLTFAAHSRGLFGQFVDWDDNTHITHNAVIHSLSGSSVWGMFTQPFAKLYIPLTWLSFAIDYRIWGNNPFGFHLTNLLLHTANTLLVYALLRQLSLERIVALLTAALFGLHPLHVESVAWATERKDLLFAGFYLLGLLAYVRWTREQRRSAYWLCFISFILSALSKSTAVTFPVTLLLLDSFWAKRTVWLEKIPFFAVSLIIGIETLLAQSSGTGQTVAGAEAIPWLMRPGLVGYCALFYVGKFFWPLHLSAIYPTFDELGWTWLTGLGFGIAFVAVTAGIFALRRRVPVLWPAWLFYLVALSPTIGLLPVGIHIVADRYAYLALLGLMVPVGLAIRRWPVTGIVFVILFALTVRQTTVWASTETLFNAVLAENPQCLPAQLNLTNWLTHQGRYAEAIAHGRQAVASAPTSLFAHRNLARALIADGQYRAAIPTLREPLAHGIPDPELWESLAKCYRAVNDAPRAALAQEQADRLRAPAGQNPPPPQPTAPPQP